MTTQHTVINDPDAGEVHVARISELELELSVSAMGVGFRFMNESDEVTFVHVEDLLLDFAKHNFRLHCGCHWCDAVRKHRELAR